MKNEDKILLKWRVKAKHYFWCVEKELNLRSLVKYLFSFDVQFTRFQQMELLHLWPKVELEASEVLSSPHIDQ